MCSLKFGYKITNNPIIVLRLEEVGQDRHRCMYIQIPSNYQKWVGS